jgi:hypothetical protein
MSALKRAANLSFANGDDLEESEEFVMPAKLPRKDDDAAVLAREFISKGKDTSAALEPPVDSRFVRECGQQHPPAVVVVAEKTTASVLPDDRPASVSDDEEDFQSWIRPVDLSGLSWQEQEAHFRLEQCRQRAELRLRQGRAHVVDILYLNLHVVPEAPVIIERPSVLFTSWISLHFSRSLQEAALSLVDSAKHYRDGDPKFAHFWTSVVHLLGLVTIGRSKTDEELQMVKLYESQTLDELQEMLREVRRKLTSPSERTHFWSSAASVLEEVIACRTVDVVHDEMLQGQSQKLAPLSVRDSNKKLIEEGSVLLQAQTLSPSLFGVSYFPSHEVVNESIEKRKREQNGKLLQMLSQVQNPREAMALVSEEYFADEVPVKHPSYSWSSRVAPMKPQYFSYVHRGYEWNRYNRTHYDKENPPPKQVMGYKFNIFYPNLTNPGQPPTYSLRQDSERPGFRILTFHGGEPYEDLAFRIVDKEWEKSHRRGFRCMFDKGVLQLHFQLQRVRYKR